MYELFESPKILYFHLNDPFEPKDPLFPIEPFWNPTMFVFHLYELFEIQKILYFHLNEPL